MSSVPPRNLSGSAALDTPAHVGRLLLRLLIGGLVLLHGVAKLRSGVGGIEGMLSSHGLPPALAFGAYIGEVVAPVLLILGVWGRVAALVVVVNMLFALGLVHSADLLRIDPKTGGWAVELQMLYLVGTACIALLGAGRYSLAGGRSRLD